MGALSNFDSVTLEIFWSRLISIADESAAALLRTSFSTIVRESNDYATVLMDANGASLAENSVGIPSFVGILPRALKHLLAAIPKSEWQDGDCIITNDPWMATGHLNDITMAAPIFYCGKLVGFSGSIAHLPDIGGAMWSADCRELFEEGLRIPPVKFLSGGQENKDVVTFIRGNVRVPDQVMGDIYAQVAAQSACARRLREFLLDSRLTDLVDLSETLQDRADQAMQRSIGALPDGTWHATVDADGYDADETHIACAVTIDGTRLHVDYAGTSKQIARGINSVMNYTYAYTVYPIKCALDPLTPRNEGSYRSVSVEAPLGSILNPRYPAPCGSRQLTGHLLAGALYKCLAQVVPEKVIAECGSAPSPRSIYTGLDAGGSRFSQVLFGSAGMGASAHADGHSCTCFPTNAGSGSVEAFESITPLIVWRKDLVPDSGGPGQFRGGLGQAMEVEVIAQETMNLSLLSDRQKHPAQGLLGGGAGSVVSITLQDGRRPHPKSRSTLEPGDRLTLELSGGGGFGPAAERDPVALQRDLEEGYVTPEGGVRDYAKVW